MNQKSINIRNTHSTLKSNRYSINDTQFNHAILNNERKSPPKSKRAKLVVMTYRHYTKIQKKYNSNATQLAVVRTRYWPTQTKSIGEIKTIQSHI